MLKIKGNEIEEPKIATSFDRKAVQIQNNIVQTLRLLEVDRDHIDMKMEKIAQRKAPASVSWYFEGRNLKYSYSQMKNFVENLYILDKVLKCEVAKLIAEEITPSQFMQEFSEDDNLSEQLVEARKTLGVDSTEKDFELISKKYKDLARTHHPDMPAGNHNTFQKINAAHKLLKKELT
jgi:hypothetical protein